ncbi:MAG: hypothetical protein ACI4S4_06285, partial [Candidatus Ornithospirochaeta sp.]
MEKKKTLGILETGIVASLSESYMMLPFMMFSSIIGGQSGVVNFFVPVVVLYSIERACLVAVRGFGEIKNPYRILKGGVLLALVGAVLMIFSHLYLPLLMAAAILIGVGLAPLKAMFIPIFSSLVAENPALKKGKAIGTGLYLALIIMTLLFGKSKIPVVPGMFLIYMAVVFGILISF